MNHLTARPGVWQLTMRAWASTRDAVGAMPLLFLSAMVLSVTLSLVTFAIPWVTNHTLIQAKSASPGMMWPALGVRAAVTIVWAILAAPVAVAVHRFILLDQVTRGPVSWLPRYTLAFVAWLVVIRLISVAVSGSMFLLHQAAAEMFVLFCAAVAMAVVGIYLAMLFPAVAVETPSKSVSARLETSMAQMNGHFWLFVGAIILAFIPLMIVMMIIQAILMRGVMRSAVAGLVTAIPPATVMVGAALTGVLQILFVALAAAAASWLYSWVSQASAPSSDAASG